MTAREPRWRFFAKQAGYAVHPGESVQKARNAGGRALADAEEQARERGWEVVWEQDGDVMGWQGDCFDVLMDPDGFEGETFPAWSAVLYGPEQYNERGLTYRKNREVLGSLGGRTFANGGDPWSDPYHEVVEAELALEALSAPVERAKARCAR